MTSTNALYADILGQGFTDTSLKAMLSLISYKVLEKVDLKPGLVGESLSVSHFILQVEIEFLCTAQGKC